MQGQKTLSSNPVRSPRGRMSGFVPISSAALLIGLTAFLGLAFDIGDLEWTRRRLQIAADSAANAGTNEILLGSSSSTIVSAARADATLNGFTDGSNGVTVTPQRAVTIRRTAQRLKPSSRRTLPFVFWRFSGTARCLSEPAPSARPDRVPIAFTS